MARALQWTFCRQLTLVTLPTRTTLTHVRLFITRSIYSSNKKKQKKIHKKKKEKKEIQKKKVSEYCLDQFGICLKGKILDEMN